MKAAGGLLGLLVGVGLGAGGAVLLLGQPRPVVAHNDRFEDYVICTGAVAVGNSRAPTDGIWLLDYRAGKLLGTVIDRNQGKVVGFAEVDLVSEFEIPPRTNVHFLMTTGNVAQGQAALYVAETTTGKFGVYTMGPAQDGSPGVQIRRHDLVPFRKGNANPPANPGS
jgi:hypothetical protein